MELLSINNNERIKEKEYERLSEETKLKLKENKENLEVKDFVKDPIIIKNKKIHENISAFLEELGTVFSFINSEYHLRLGNRYNYIDLLLFNIEYNPYVVVELKKKHIGQIQIYMNYI